LKLEIANIIDRVMSWHKTNMKAISVLNYCFHPLGTLVFWMAHQCVGYSENCASWNQETKSYPFAREFTQGSPPRLSFETMASSIPFPILLSQSDKDEIVCEYYTSTATGNKALQRHVFFLR
jgi:hypothetical protein